MFAVAYGTCPAIVALKTALHSAQGPFASINAIRVPPPTGISIPAGRKLLGPFVNPGRCTRMQIHRTMSQDDMVMNERTETWEYEGTTVVLPVAGVFRIEDGKIARWNDYFDEKTIKPLIERFYAQ
ncbi:TPA: hypothetical protein L4Q76_001761 [Pseudomonas aeruginosa]|uniref:limonene-1,2-epoxide hydrolase family protein n=1 Tax=Pseudomonas aeruginosa TaxID=287 RepID=UPI00067707A2|nr:limonene-1,2-epoxide hydrolase family protein [Pseudomonas aeruginosa]MBH4028546.1 hypothetical protein [Pseudomonas aeruginosa]MBV5530484.1 hypothetical protein [Pseudomonas aeruginosa]MCS8095471.1 nuclear transport factor 2 family protein [Pseudomonas aeruginosa]RTS98563.1 hypothetical protein DY952_10610 [Pseudomonas aeruginosa]HBO2879740.1 hypothetical protein [Pseudomonas aeruginosa]